MENISKARTVATILNVGAIIAGIAVLLTIVIGFFAAAESGASGEGDAVFIFFTAIFLACGSALFGVILYGLAVALRLMAAMAEKQETPPPTQMGEQGSYQ